MNRTIHTAIKSGSRTLRVRLHCLFKAMLRNLGKSKSDHSNNSSSDQQQQQQEKRLKASHKGSNGSRKAFSGKKANSNNDEDHSSHRYRPLDPLQDDLDQLDLGPSGGGRGRGGVPASTMSTSKPRSTASANRSAMGGAGRRQHQRSERHLR